MTVESWPPFFFRLRSHVRSDPSLSLRLMLFKHADLGEYVLVKGLRSIECVIADMVLDNDNGIVKSSLRIKADDVPQSVATCYVELSCTVGQLMDKMLLLLRTDGQWTPCEIDVSIGTWTLQADVVVLMRTHRNKLLVQWLPAAGNIAIYEGEGARRVRRRVA